MYTMNHEHTDDASETYSAEPTKTSFDELNDTLVQTEARATSPVPLRRVLKSSPSNVRAFSNTPPPSNSPLPHSPKRSTHDFDEERLLQSATRGNMPDRSIAKVPRSKRRHYTLSEYLVRFIPGLITGLLVSYAWWWVKLGWRPWSRTDEEQALWCRSSRVESLFL